MTIIDLEIRSWVGVSIGAVHTYGTLHFKDKDGKTKETLELIRPMTRAERREYNAQMAADGYPDLKATPGQTTNGFKDEGEVIVHAIKAAKKKLGNDNFLMIKREHYSCSARPVVHAPPSFEIEKDCMNALSNALEEAEKRNAPNKVLDEIDNQFNAIVAKAQEL